MSYKYLIDSFAWVEYFSASKKGEKIKVIIEKEKISTSIITIAELSDKFARENKDFAPYFSFISSRSAIVPISFKVAASSGKLKFEIRKKYKSFGIADAIIYLTAKENNAKLITGDYHFKDFNEVLFLK